jgi:hypothetical protein
MCADSNWDMFWGAIHWGWTWSSDFVVHTMIWRLAKLCYAWFVPPALYASPLASISLHDVTYRFQTENTPKGWNLLIRQSLLIYFQCAPWEPEIVNSLHELKTRISEPEYLDLMTDLWVSETTTGCYLNLLWKENIADTWCALKCIQFSNNIHVNYCIPAQIAGHRSRGALGKIHLGC